MAYVDLNPVRAGIATTPEGSEFTSIYARIQALSSLRLAAPIDSTKLIPAHKLFAFRDQAPSNTPALPMALKDYLQLVDWTGRGEIREAWGH